jgi:hypothetical protein
VKFYQYVPARIADAAAIAPDAPRSQDSGVNRRESGTQARFTEVFDALRDEFRQRPGGAIIEIPLLRNISNTSKVVINGLDYRLIRGEQLALGVQCRRGIASGSEIELWGRVTIQADGRKLVSNHVVWDMEKDLFSVPGTYILDREGMRVQGAGIRCDLHLEPLVAPGVYSKEGVEKWTRDSLF